MPDAWTSSAEIACNRAIIHVEGPCTCFLSSEYSTGHNPRQDARRGSQCSLAHSPSMRFIVSKSSELISLAGTSR
jgi:hypothetical protein